MPIRFLTETIAALLLTGAAAAQSPNRPQPPQAAAAQPLPRASFIVEMDTQFRKIDADKNGQLMRIEIEQFQKLQAVAEAEERNRALFAHLDSDKNRQISQAEFGKLVTPPPAANASPMLQREDANKDQQISLIEHRAATLANFDRIDTDKDGIVTPTEMKAGGITPR